MASLRVILCRAMTCRSITVQLKKSKSTTSGPPAPKSSFRNGPPELVPFERPFSEQKQNVIFIGGIVSLVVGCWFAWYTDLFKPKLGDYDWEEIRRLRNEEQEEEEEDEDDDEEEEEKVEGDEEAEEVESGEVEAEEVEDEEVDELIFREDPVKEVDVGNVTAAGVVIVGVMKAVQTVAEIIGNVAPIVEEGAEVVEEVSKAAGEVIPVLEPLAEVVEEVAEIVEEIAQEAEHIAPIAADVAEKVEEIAEDILGGSGVHVVMSDSPVAKKVRIGEDTNGTQEPTPLQGFQQQQQQIPQQLIPQVPAEPQVSSPLTLPQDQQEVPPSEPAVPSPPKREATPEITEPQPAVTPPAPPPPAPPVIETRPVEPEVQNQGRVDPNQIIAQLKENLRQEEAKLAFLKKLKLTQAKLKEHQEKLAQKSPNQTKEVNYSNNNTTLPPPPPLIKPDSNRCINNAAGKPFSVIVSNSQAIQPKPEPTSLHQSLNTITSNSIQQNMHRATNVPVQTTSRAAMAKILEEMILQQPSPKPKVLQWPICPNINDIEYLHFTGLEFIVDRLKNPNRMKISNPGADITCIVCGLDFSPEWEKTDSEDQFECYYCFTSKLRKQVREEHTERLKQGFIKVVQKEKEFEKQLQVQQQREEQLIQHKLQEQQRQQQHLLEVRAAEQQRNLQLQLQQQTLEQLQRQQIANQLLQHLQKSRQQPGGNSVLNSLLQEPNALLQQLQKRGQQSLQNNTSSTNSSSTEQEKSNDHQLREYLLDLIPRLPTQ